jgi:Trypsin-co-occurring domain 1
VLDEEIANTVALVPLEVDGGKLYVAAHLVNPDDWGTTAEEQEIAARPAKIDQMLHGLTGFAKQVVDGLRTTGATKMTVQFGCEIALESGSFVAVIGKASGKSTLSVSLEWSSPSP